jgi:osmotically-inducible protein OsmY
LFSSAYLRAENLFNLADLLLDFASEFLVLAFSRQVRVVRHLSRLLFGFALHFMKLAFELVLRALFHLFLLFSSTGNLGNPIPNAPVEYGVGIFRPDFRPSACPEGVDRSRVKGEIMKMLKPCLALLAVVAVGTLVGCSTTTKAADVLGSIRTSLDQAGLNDVSANQDREKGVVTLGGHVASDRDKAQAESIARSMAGPQVVSNQIAVIPLGVESEAKKVNSDLDKGIESNLDAALILEDLHKSVKYAVRNHVVTLTGEVKSQTTRARAERVASGVPNVQQVVNELQVKGQKATSSN